ncbi:MAG: hypothetical protein JKY37_23065 [Nannocystaceae bacterium]|nr:hypothetical protein [Nannocystaceae bacterium]
MNDAETLRSTGQCSSCGAIIELPSQQVSGACSYCASQLVDVERGDTHIDRVAPFRVPREAALDRLRQHLAKRLWAPSALRRLAAQGAIETRMHGMLVPFYVYAAQCRSTYRARIGVHWYRKKTVKGKDGKTREKRIQETEWFPLQGSAVGQFHGHFECASRGLTAAESAAIRDFDLGRAVAFDPHLLAGWHAELPSRTSAVVDRQAVGHIRKLEMSRIKDHILPGDTHRGVQADINVELLGVQLILLPVWITTYVYGGEVFRMLVHGQNGTCIGRAPVSRAKVVGAAMLVATLGVAMLYLWGVLR